MRGLVGGIGIVVGTFGAVLGAMTSTTAGGRLLEAMGVLALVSGLGLLFLHVARPRPRT